MDRKFHPAIEAMRAADVDKLHYAALNGHRAMVEFLLAHGADRSIKDTRVNSTAAGWADHGGHPELRGFLAEA